METAKPGSKLAQLQALRGQKQLQRKLLGEVVHAIHSDVEREIMSAELLAEVLDLKAKVKRLQAENVMLRAGRNVTCPKCEAAKKANADRVRASRARRKAK